MAPILRELDSRRRISLAGIGDPAIRRCFVSAETDGTIVLTPAVVMTAAEAAELGELVVAEDGR